VTIAYILGMSLWIAVLAALMTSAAHVVPESIFPDVTDWDEFRSRERRERLYCGAINFIRKLASAFATFFALQILGWSGYRAPPEGATVVMRAPAALGAIRFLAGPGVILLLGRESQRRIRRLLTLRRARTAAEGE
jgi:GPH family glycoside/pentoside/hexuronide:cation symporter